MMKDYYNEIDIALKSHENYKPYHEKSINWITDRISWCYQFKHITYTQMIELSNRCIAIFEYK